MKKINSFLTADQHKVLERGWEQAALRFLCDGKFAGGFNQLVRLELQAHITLRVHLKNARADGRCIFRINHPQLIIFVRRKWLEILYHENAAMLLVIAAKNVSAEQVRPDSRTAGRVPLQLYSDDLSDEERSTKHKIQKRSHYAYGSVETRTSADA